jgi:hypothetical protein
MGNLDLQDNEKFMGLLMLNKDFRTIIRDTVRSGNQSKLESVLADSMIKLPSNMVSTIMGWPVDDQLWLGYFDVIDYSKQAYDPALHVGVW